MSEEDISELLTNEESEQFDALQVMVNIWTDRGAVGLAAPQVGYMKRMFLMRTMKEGILVINPEILDKSRQERTGWEECLSIPDARALVSRYKRIKVRFVGWDGEKRTMVFTGLPSLCFQHELDHLNGKLIIDRDENGKGKE